VSEEAAGQSLSAGEAERAYIADLVRSADQDRYWAGLLMPRPARDHLLALYAFNIELAKIGEQVRAPQLGAIRLEWWRGTLAAPPGERSGNPVADALSAARAAHALPVAELECMIDARSLDVEREPVATMDALESYLRATAGGVFRLGARIAGAPEARVTLAGNEAALAYGLTGLMRALPYHAERGQLYLPADFLGAFGVDGAAVLAGEESQGLKTALGVLRERARGHLAAYRAAAKALPRSALQVFLPLALIPAYLRQLGNPAHRPLTEIAQLNPLGRYARIWRAYLRGAV
jgi:phytoene synthase